MVVWDRLRAHRALKGKDFLTDHRYVRAIFLPPYAPELNSIEYLCGLIRACFLIGIFCLGHAGTLSIPHLLKDRNYLFHCDAGKFIRKRID